MTYLFDSLKGIKGQIADGSLRVVDSFAAEEELEFGAALERGTDPDKQVKMYDDGVFAGVALFSPTEKDDVYKEKTQAAVLTKGRVFVDVLSVEVVAGEKAYLTAAGAFTNVEGSNLLIGRFLSSGDGLQILELN